MVVSPRMHDRKVAKLFNCCHLQVFHSTKCNCLKFSTSISKLSALLELNLLGCSKLQELPTFIGQLNAFQELNLSECFSLEELPTSIGN
jgi:Leucine-rich repeat (LRR) protein